MNKRKQRRRSPYNPAVWQERAYREGRGRGEGADYKSWIQVRRFDFASRGRSHIWLDVLTPIEDHHVLSNVELYAIPMLQWAGAYIRTQYPLSLEGLEQEFWHIYDRNGAYGSVAISQKLGFKHPLISREKEKVMSTDILCRFPNKQIVAVYVKYGSKETAREREKRLIAEEYWKIRGVIQISLSLKDIHRPALRWFDWLATIRGQVTTDEAKMLAACRNNFLNVLLNTDADMPMRWRLDEVSCILQHNFTTLVVWLKTSLWLREVSADFSIPPELSLAWRLKKISPGEGLPEWHFLTKENPTMKLQLSGDIQ